MLIITYSQHHSPPNNKNTIERKDSRCPAKKKQHIQQEQ